MQAAYLQLIIAGLNAINAAIQALVPAAPAAGPFLQTPLRSGANAIIDFSTKEGKKFYERATAPLLPDGEIFDMEPSKFQTLMNQLCDWARDIRLLDAGQIAHVPPDMQHPNVGLIDSITNYGRLTLE